MIDHPRHRTAILALPLLAVLLSTQARAQDDAGVDALLSKERWREMSYGVSLRPPLGTMMNSRNLDDALVRIHGGEEYTITVHIKNLRQELTINQVVSTAIEQFGFTQPTATIEHQQVTKPAGRPGWIVYFGVNTPAKQKPEEKPDREAMMRAARAQMTRANELREKQKDEIAAFRLYSAIARNSPDKAIAAQAKRWVDAYQTDQQFMRRYLLDEAARRQRNPHDVDTKAWYMGQAIMQLAPNTFVILQLEVGQESFAKVRPIFEAVVKSLQVQHPKELDEMRNNLMKVGAGFKTGLTHRRLLEAMLPPVPTPIVSDKGEPAGIMPLRLQYVRVLQNGKDVGWMKTVHRERRDQIVVIDTVRELDVNTGRHKTRRIVEIKETGVNGIGVDTYVRIHFDDRAIDSHSQFFLAEHGDYESWSIRNTVRDRVDADPGQPRAAVPAKAPAPAPAKAAPQPRYHVRTWLETGIQNKDQLTIIREGPTGIERADFLAPRKAPNCYITQTELALMAPLLPRDPFECGFYAYYPNTGTISFRTLRVESDGRSGGYRVMSRPSPDSSEQVTEYDAKGGLVRRSLGEGREVVPTTRQELAKIWNVELPEETADFSVPNVQEQPLPPTRGRIER